MFNVNCIYAIKAGYHIQCDHPDRGRVLKIFRRSCMEPERNCTLKVAFKKPVIAIFTPPPMRKRS